MGVSGEKHEPGCTYQPVEDETEGGPKNRFMPVSLLQMMLCLRCVSEGRATEAEVPDVKEAVTGVTAGDDTVMTFKVEVEAKDTLIGTVVDIETGKGIGETMDTLTAVPVPTVTNR